MKTLSFLSILVIMTGAAAEVGTLRAETAHDFTLPSATSPSLVRLSDYRGKVVLINGGSISCGWCQREKPRLIDLYRKYRAKGLVIISVLWDDAETLAEVPEYLRKHGISWPFAIYDYGEFRQQMGRRISRFPANFLISRSGQLASLGVDRTDESWQELESAVIRALNEPSTQSAIKPHETVSVPDFSLTDFRGRALTRRDIVGTPTIVHVFDSSTADWCGAAMSKIHRQFAPRGLQVVGLNYSKGAEQTRNYISRYNAEYPVFNIDYDTLQLVGGKTWGVFLIKADGTVFKSFQTFYQDMNETVFPRYAAYLVRKSSASRRSVAPPKVHKSSTHPRPIQQPSRHTTSNPSNQQPNASEKAYFSRMYIAMLEFALSKEARASDRAGQLDFVGDLRTTLPIGFAEMSEGHQAEIKRLLNEHLQREPDAEFQNALSEVIDAINAVDSDCHESCAINPLPTAIGGASHDEANAGSSPEASHVQPGSDKEVAQMMAELEESMRRLRVLLDNSRSTP